MRRFSTRSPTMGDTVTGRPAVVTTAIFLRLKRGSKRSTTSTPIQCEENSSRRPPNMTGRRRVGTLEWSERKCRALNCRGDCAIAQVSEYRDLWHPDDAVSAVAPGRRDSLHLALHHPH